MSEATIRTPDIQNIDIVRLMVIVLEQCSTKPDMREPVTGKFFAHLVGNDISLVIADPMVNRIASVVMWSEDRWKIRADLPKNWPKHFQLKNGVSYQPGKSDRFPSTVLPNRHIEGAEALARDLTLLRVFF